MLSQKNGFPEDDESMYDGSLDDEDLEDSMVVPHFEPSSVDETYWGDIKAAVLALLAFGGDEYQLTPHAMGTLRAILEAAEQSDDSYFDGWHQADVAEYLNPEISLDYVPAPGPRFSVGQATTGAVVFLPILWTWLCLAAASRAFAAYSKTQQSVGRSFLDLWHSGFGGHLAWPFQFAFFTTGACILSLVVLAILFYDAGRNAEVDKRQESRAAAVISYRQRVQELKRSIGVHAVSSLARLDSTIAKSIVSMSELIQISNHAAREILDATKKSHVSIENFSTAAANSIQEFKNIGSIIEQIPSELTSIFRNAEQLLESIDDFSARQISAFGNFIDIFVQLIPNIGKLEQHVSDELNKIIDKLHSLETEDLSLITNRRKYIESMYEQFNVLVRAVSENGRSAR